MGQECAGLVIHDILCYDWVRKIFESWFYQAGMMLSSKEEERKMQKRKWMTGAVIMLMAASLWGCSNKSAQSDSELREKLDSANEQVKEDESMDEFSYENWTDGCVAIYKYNGPGGDVEIPEELGGKKVVRINSTTFSGAAKIKSLTVPACVQEIDNETFETEDSTVTIRAYRNTAAMSYANYKGIACEILGENPAQASSVSIYNSSGKECETLTLGDSGTKSYTEGVSFEKKDGKSVLILDGCQSGSIIVEEFASLTIELADGSQNLLSAGAGRDGISVNGSLTITGNGSLSVKGSDIYSKGEGDSWWIGYGIYAYGDVMIDNHAKVSAECGKSTERTAFAVYVEAGNLTVDHAGLEMLTPDTEAASCTVMIMDDGSGKYGQITLKDSQIVKGGAVVAVTYDARTLGSSIGEKGVVTVDEDGNMINAAQYVRIE